MHKTVPEEKHFLCRQEARMQISKLTPCQFKFQTLKTTHPFCSICEFDWFINELKTRSSAASWLYFLTAPVWMDAGSLGDGCKSRSFV